MIRTLLFAVGIAAATLATAQTNATLAQEKKEDKTEKKTTVDLFASIDDRELQKSAPESGVIASVAAWEKLAKAWGIKEPARVDFDKEFLYVATTLGSRLNVSGGRLDDKGDFKVAAIATRDLRPGFRYAIKSFSREGVKTVNGKEFPKE